MEKEIDKKLSEIIEGINRLIYELQSDISTEDVPLINPISQNYIDGTVKEKVECVKQLFTGLSSLIRDRDNKIRTLKQKLINSEKEAALGILTSGIAHEFNNLISGISAYTETIYNLGSNDKILNNSLQRIIECTGKMEELIFNLLNYSKKDDQTIETADVKKIISSAVTFVNHRLKKNNIRLTVTENEPVLLKCDSARIEQVILNILINSIDAVTAESEGIIDIILEKDSEFCYIRIKDNGPGIPEEEKDNIFLPFYSTKGSYGNGKTGGTGLGLSISLDIIRGFEGDIEYKSGKNKGTEFIIKIPFDIEKERKKRFFEVRALNLELENQISEKQRVCFIENNRDENIIIKDFLTLNNISFKSIKPASDNPVIRESDIIILDFNKTDIINRIMRDINNKILILLTQDNDDKINQVLELLTCNISIKLYYILKPYRISDINYFFYNLFNSNFSGTTVMELNI